MVMASWKIFKLNLTGINEVLHGVAEAGGHYPPAFSAP